jgi:hypothetical protein
MMGKERGWVGGRNPQEGTTVLGGREDVFQWVMAKVLS